MNMPVQEKSNPSSIVSSNKASQFQAFTVEEDFSTLVSEVSSSVKKYCLHRPRVVAATIFAIGFILGWRMRPW